MSVQTNVTMPIEEYNKLLEIQKAAMENSIIVIVSMMGSDTMIVQSKDEAMNKLGEIIKSQSKEIDRLDSEVQALKNPVIPVFSRKTRSFWHLLFD